MSLPQEGADSSEEEPQPKATPVAKANAKVASRSEDEEESDVPGFVPTVISFPQDHHFYEKVFHLGIPRF